MKLLAVFAFSGIVLCLVNCTVNKQEREWVTYKSIHGKKYETHHDNLAHRSVWTKNKKMVEQHNKNFESGKTLYKMEINKFSDLTPKDLKMYKGFSLKRFNTTRENTPKWKSKVNSPDQIDWRDLGAVVGVKDQGQCSSCYVFSAVGAIEGQHFQSTGELVSLSEEQVLDCNNNACNPGYMTKVYDYVKSVGGIEQEDSYPYTAPSLEGCQFDEDLAAATVGGYLTISADENSLKDAIGTMGPASIAIRLTNTFMHYSTGIYDEDPCSSDYGHAILAIGYGSDGGTDIWIVKNSWVSKSHHPAELI